MKKLKHFINWTIWSLLALYLLLVVLIHVPVVQGWMGNAVANMLSKKLGTEVSVGRVDVGMLNRLIIDDVKICDQHQKTMLQVERLSVKADLLPLFEGQIRISSAQLFGAQLKLSRDDAQSKPNYQFVVDALTSGNNDDNSPIDLRVGSLVVRRLSVTYDQNDAPETPGRLNMRHLNVSDVSAHVLLRDLTQDSLNINIKRISLKEQSGLYLRQLSFKTEANRQKALLTDFTLQLPHSTFDIDTIETTYQHDNLANTICYRLPSFNSSIDLSDIKCLLAETYPTAHTIDIETSVSGTSRQIICPRLSLRTNDQTLALQASGHYDADKAWNIDIRQMDIAASLADDIRQMLPGVPDLFTRLGNISLTCQAEGSGDDDQITAQGRIRTGIGNLSVEGHLTESDDSWTAHLATDSLDLKAMTEYNALGLLSANIDLHSRGEAVNVKGTIPRIDINGYSYSELTLDGSYTPAAITGKMHISDPALQADLEGSYTKGIRLTGVISHISPQALHLSDRWGAASFAAIFDADFTTTSFSDAQGTLDLDDFFMIVDDTTRYHLDNLHLRSGYEDQRRYLRMTSDFGEIQLKGRFDWSTLPQSFTAILPQAIGLPKRRGDNDFTLSMQIDDSQWMQHLLGINLDLNGKLDIEAEVDDDERMIEVKASLPSFSYGGNEFRNATLLLSALGDSTQCDARVTRLSDKGQPLYVKLSTQVEGNEILSSVTLSNDGRDGGTINAVTQTYRNDEGQRETHVRLMPSAIVLRNVVWELEPCDIIYNDKRLMIDQFTLHHDDEHIIIDGLASAQLSDSLMLDLQGIDVQSVLDMVNFHSVKFDGKASGRAYVTHAFSEPEAWADITIDHFLFQEAPLGTLEAHAIWNNDEGQLELEAAIDDGAEAQTFVDGYISTRRKEIDLGIRARGTSIGFVHDFTESFISNISGHAYGDIRLFGPLSHIDLEGAPTVVGQATLSPLGTTYHFQGDTIHLSEGTIAFSDFRAYDRDEHAATLNGALHHNNFKNFTFDLVAQANALLAYDFPELETGSTIGGCVWANGQAVMRGKPGEVTIDCDVTPAPGSFFIYNAASPDAISQQHFITWGLAEPSNDTPDPAMTPHYDNTTRSDLRLNLRINATPDATLRLLMDQHSGDYITLNGTGTLRASYYNKAPFQMYGTFAVERGTYSMTIQNILKKNFLFQPGSSLVFGGDPLQAALNLKAQYTVNGVSLSDLGLGNSFTSNTIRVNCLMNILGTAGEPRVEFDLEMPTVNSEEEQMIRSIITSEQELNQQVVYLLGIGRFYTQGANNADTQPYGQTELAMQSLLSGTVSSQINELLSQVIKNDDWNFGANISTGNEGWHNAEYEGLVSGRMLNNRLLINGQFGYRDNATQATPSFIGDFDISYLLTPSGNLALKAYNQTNDRYFTHSSLNTQGIGVIMKKDFNGLADLFSHRRKKAKKN